MDYLIGGLVVWAIVSLPIGIFLGRMFYHMGDGQWNGEYSKGDYSKPDDPYMWFTYSGPNPVMPLERDDEDEPEPKERMN